MEAVSITIGCACGEDVSGHTLHSIMRYLNAYGKRSHQALQREVHALVVLILYYTAQFITNHKVTLRIPEKSAEFSRGQSHTLDFDKLSTSNQETSKTNRTCPSSTYFVC